MTEPSMSMRERMARAIARNAEALALSLAEALERIREDAARCYKIQGGNPDAPSSTKYGQGLALRECDAALSSPVLARLRGK